MTWNDYPLTLNAHQVAEIFGLHVSTVQKRVERASGLIPQPAFIRPYRWRREDVRRFYETASLESERRIVSHEAREATS